MNIPPPLRDSAAAERRARTTLSETSAFATAMGLSATGSPVLGVAIGSLPLGYGVKREGTVEQQLKANVLQVCRLAAAVGAVYIGRDILANLADFKQGLVEGWRAV